MKRFAIVFVLTFTLFAGTVLADTQVLIDFGILTADTQIGDRFHNAATMIDFSGAAGASYTDEEKREMKVSLALDQWEVMLASSSKTVENLRFSFTKPITSRRYGTVLGARIHFPTGAFNSWAIIKPPFEIPVFETPTKIENDDLVPLTQPEIDQVNQQRGASLGDTNYLTKRSKFDGIGVAKNVGILKSISVTAYGSNFPHGLGIRLADQSHGFQDIFVGYLDYDGWKTIVWQNPNYIDEVRNREVTKAVLYPQASPYIKFIGFVIYRDAQSIGGDFVTYFKDIEVTYDKAVLTLDRDIDDEEAWGIIEERDAQRRAAEEARVGNMQVLRFLENKKKHRVETTP
jgi:hypothetical protein